MKDKYEVVVKKVETEDELSEVYKLRFKVYCRERGFESEEDYPNKREMDEYDPYSIHFIAIIDSETVGTVRLILNNPIGFPFEKNCKISISRRGVKRGKTVEISRLAVSKKVLGYNRTKIVFGLFREIYHESKNLGISFFCAAMERSLYRLLSRCSIRFLQIGLPVEYHGLRAPFFAELKDLEANVFLQNPNLFKLVAEPRARTIDFISA
jgi:N-acyl-L-homoserine lactone synthetase